MPSLKQKGKIPVQEAKTPESPKLKSKFTRIPKEKEPEPEVIKLKKVPVKPPEPDKQVVTHKAKVTRHHDPELTVHGLHDRDDREIITLGRTERVLTADEETIELSHFEQMESLTVVQKPEPGEWIRTLKPQKDEAPEEPHVAKKKITKLPKADEQKESVKLKPFETFGKQDAELQAIKLKKVPPKPKEPEKEVITHKVEVTRHYDAELTVQKLRDREDRELVTVERKERVFTAAEETSELSFAEEPEKLEAEDEKSRWVRAPKAPKEDEPESDLNKKKIKKLPKKDEDQEVVTLKPFQKPQKQEAAEPPKAKTEAEAKTDTERSPYMRSELPQRDQPAAAVKHQKDDDAPLMNDNASPDISKDQKEIPHKKKVDQVPKDVETTAAEKLRGKPKIISTPDKEKEQVVLKPFTKITKPEEKPEKASEEKKKPLDTKVPSQATKEPKEQLKKAEKTVMPKKDNETPQEKEKPAEKPRPPGQKEEERPSPQKQTDILKKSPEIKKTPSPKAKISKDKPEEEKPLKPIEQLKKVELKKTPSPKIEKIKPNEVEQIPIEKKPSGEKVKRIPKTVSPKDSTESVTLKKVPKKPSPEAPSQPERPDKGRIPLVKEISPGAVEMKRVTTQPEEEVFEEEGEKMVADEDEEVWDWELVPPEDWEGEGVDGALETPGMPGAKRGEVKAGELVQLMPLESPHPISDDSSNLHYIQFYVFNHIIYLFISAYLFVCLSAHCPSIHV